MSAFLFSGKTHWARLLPSMDRGHRSPKAHKHLNALLGDNFCGLGCGLAPPLPLQLLRYQLLRGGK